MARGRRSLPSRSVTGALPRYTGTKQPSPTDLDATGRPIRPYIPTPEIVEAVELAIFLRRPLLLRGEPGCGKTQLAQAVAFELGLGLETWSVRSTTRAEDGLYVYDAIARLYDAQLAAAKVLRDRGNPNEIKRYINFGPLGRAFNTSSTTILLIDEIDKADIDFPNDLLDVLDQMRFTIKETGEQAIPKYAPVIFITSNDEKELSAAFLRRCLFTFIGFPSRDRLHMILKSHFGRAPEAVVTQAVDRFLELRGRQIQDPLGSPKPVSTSELIDWFRVLIREDNVLDKLAPGQPYPFTPTLIKRSEDADTLSARMGETWRP
jgi:MoxR-like ATPase